MGIGNGDLHRAKHRDGGLENGFAMRFPHGDISKRLPFCLWQAGISFRDEKNAETMRASKLRLVQFHQLEFQLFASRDSKAPYLERALARLVSVYGGGIHQPADLPHYSVKTLDWMMNELEVAGCSVRTDWPQGMVFEVAIGLDRLVAIQMSKK